MKANTNPDYDILERYIAGTLEEKERVAVQEKLRSNRHWFEAHLELKEALLLSKTGTAASARLRDEVQRMVKRQRAGFVSILITIVKEKITISSADQSGQDFQGVSAEFALRGESEAGPVTITRKIADRTVTILLTPLERKESFGLSVVLAKPEKLTAKLIIDDVEKEIIQDISKQNAFETQLVSPCEVDVAFFHKDTEEFTVNLKLRGERGK